MASTCSGKEKIQPDPIKTEWVCNSCTLSNKLDLKNLHSATCEACEKEDKNIFKQIESALNTKQKETWKCCFCNKVNDVDWKSMGSSVCPVCYCKDLGMQTRI